MNIKQVTGLLLLVGSSTFNNANALPPPPPPPTACSPSEVSLGGSNADTCFGYFGSLANSNPTSETTALNAAVALDPIYKDPGDFSLIFRNDNGGDGSGTFLGGLLLSMTGVAGGAVFDTWTFNWQDTNGSTTPNLPFFIDLVFGFKAGSGSSSAGVAFFLFNDFKLTDNPYQTSGSFNLIVNKGLSHNGLWARVGEEKTTPVCDPTTGIGCEELPEPNSIALLGIGLLGFGIQKLRGKANRG